MDLTAALRQEADRVAPLSDQDRQALEADVHRLEQLAQITATDAAVLDRVAKLLRRVFAS